MEPSQNMNMTPLRGDCPQAAPTQISQGRFAKRSGGRWLGWLVVGATALAGCANLSTQMLPFSSKTGDTEAKLAYARLMEKHGQGDQAEQLYQVMIKQDQRQQFAYQRLGVLSASRGQYAEANDFFKKAASIAPPTPELYNDIGYNYYLQDRLDEAEKCYRQALERNPRYAAAHNNLGLALGQQRRYDESLAEFRHGGPEAHAYTNLAYLCAQNRELSKAKQYYSRALDLDPSLKPAAEGLIQLAAITGEIAPSRNQPPKKGLMVAGRDDKPSSPSALRKVSHSRPPQKPPAGTPDAPTGGGKAEKSAPDAADVATSATKADANNAATQASVLPKNVEPFSWKQPEMKASTNTPASKDVAGANAKKARSGQELIQDWQDRKPQAQAHVKSPASTRNIEVSVEDLPARRGTRGTNRSAPGTSRPPSMAQLAAVRQSPATETQSPSGVAKHSGAVKKPLAPRELPAGQPESKLVSARSIAPQTAPAQPVWMQQLVAHWTTLPTTQSVRIEKMLAASRAAARKPPAEYPVTSRNANRRRAEPGLVLNASHETEAPRNALRPSTPVAHSADVAADAACSGGPTARLPAPPAPRGLLRPA